MKTNLQPQIQNRKAVTKVEGDEVISQVTLDGSDVILKEMQTGKKRPVGSNRRN